MFCLLVSIYHNFLKHYLDFLQRTQTKIRIMQIRISPPAPTPTAKMFTSCEKNDSGVVDDTEVGVPVYKYNE